MIIKNEKIHTENFNTNSSQKIFWSFQNYIEEINKKSNHKNYLNEEILTAKKTINFMDSNWLFTTFDTDKKNNLEYPIIKNQNWDKQNQIGSEIRNLIFQSIEDINYDIVNCEIKSTFILKGGSSFWLFLRSKNIFSVYTVAICFTKEQFYQKINLSLGIFHKNFKGNLEFRVFNKQQLTFSDKEYKENPKNIKYENEDTIIVNTKIYDSGNQNIIVSTSLNESKYENIVKGNFFLPVEDDKNKIMIAGSGDQCKIKSFICNTSFKTDYSHYDPFIERNGCDCCLFL